MPLARDPFRDLDNLSFHRGVILFLLTRAIAGIHAQYGACFNSEVQEVRSPRSYGHVGRINISSSTDLSYSFPTALQGSCPCLQRSCPRLQPCHPRPCGIPGIVPVAYTLPSRQLHISPDVCARHSYPQFYPCPSLPTGPMPGTCPCPTPVCSLQDSAS